MNNKKKALALARLANMMVGVVETKPNGGFAVERFQSATDGKHAGEAWCVGFAQFLVRRVDELFNELDYRPWCSDFHTLPTTEWTIGVWNGAEKASKLDVPEVGCLVVWKSQGDGSKGHLGIVVEVKPNGDIVTVEGNTSASSGNQRDGDGVWQKTRIAGNIPGFVRLGYVKPWL